MAEPQLSPQPLGAIWQALPPRAIVVVGASGGIGAAMVSQLKNSYPDCTVIGLSNNRAVEADHHLSLDYRSESSIENCAGEILAIAPALDAVINCAGILHSSDLAPEKSLRKLQQASLREVMDINAYGPVLLAKQLASGFKHSRRSLFASLSARVGSISDNQAGGWYSYRASKAAHNMLLTTLAIEWRRTHPQVTVAMFQPGTVDTGLSRPFQRNVKQLLKPEQSARHLLEVFESLTLDESGDFLDWQGNSLAF